MDIWRYYWGEVLRTFRWATDEGLLFALLASGCTFVVAALIVKFLPSSRRYVFDYWGFGLAIPGTLLAFALVFVFFTVIKGPELEKEQARLTDRIRDLSTQPIKAQADLAAANGRLATINFDNAVKIQELNGELLPHFRYMTGRCAVRLLRSLTRPEVIKGIPRSLVVITSNPVDNYRGTNLKDDIASVIDGAQWFLGNDWVLATVPEPDSNRLLNFPKLTPSGEDGLIVYGSSAAANVVYDALKATFVITRRAPTMQEGQLVDYYRTDPYYGQYLAPTGSVVWVEVGKGSPIPPGNMDCM